MVRFHLKREGPTDFENKMIALYRHPTKKIEILWAHQKEKQHTNNGTRRKKRKGNIHKVDQATHGFLIFKSGQG